jgi:hypothetical protein
VDLLAETLDPLQEQLVQLPIMVELPEDNLSLQILELSMMSKKATEDDMVDLLAETLDPLQEQLVQLPIMVELPVENLSLQILELSMISNKATEEDDPMDELVARMAKLSMVDQGEDAIVTPYIRENTLLVDLPMDELDSTMATLSTTDEGMDNIVATAAAADVYDVSVMVELPAGTLDPLQELLQLPIMVELPEETLPLQLLELSISKQAIEANEDLDFDTIKCSDSVYVADDELSLVSDSTFVMDDQELDVESTPSHGSTDELEIDDADHVSSHGPSANTNEVDVDDIPSLDIVTAGCQEAYASTSERSKAEIPTLNLRRSPRIAAKNKKKANLPIGTQGSIVINGKRRSARLSLF